MTAKNDKIRELNDAFRTTFQGGRVLITAGVEALPQRTREVLMEKIRTFSKFDPGDDPYLQHDFGAIDDLDGQNFLWKIDYYDKNMENGSDDASDPAKTTRVLTVMLTEEY